METLIGHHILRHLIWYKYSKIAFWWFKKLAVVRWWPLVEFHFCYYLCLSVCLSICLSMVHPLTALNRVQPYFQLPYTRFVQHHINVWSLFRGMLAIKSQIIFVSDAICSDIIGLISINFDVYQPFPALCVGEAKGWVLYGCACQMAPFFSAARHMISPFFAPMA